MVVEHTRRVVLFCGVTCCCSDLVPGVPKNLVIINKYVDRILTFFAHFFLQFCEIALYMYR